MVKTTVVKMTPEEVTTQGYMKIKEWGQPMRFRFLADPDFRGSLKTVTWNLPDGVEHTISSSDEAFALFEQVGERPEVEVDSSWVEGLGLPTASLLRIRFEFETFRMEPVWYAYLYLRSNYGDSQEGADIPYKVKPQVPEDQED